MMVGEKRIYRRKERKGKWGRDIKGKKHPPERERIYAVSRKQLCTVPLSESKV